MRGFGGGKLAGQSSSPAQGLQAFTWIRCSSPAGVGRGVFVRVSVLEVAVC